MSPFDKEVHESPIAVDEKVTWFGFWCIPHLYSVHTAGMQFLSSKLSVLVLASAGSKNGSVRCAAGSGSRQLQSELSLARTQSPFGRSPQPVANAS